jgi:glycine/D-amino acid oxidase-like deaminating enzyme
MTSPDSTKAIHWYKTAVSAPVCPTLKGSIEADFVVVGGGLTGTRTAIGLAEAGASVAVLEAKTISWGASGRSGGQCNPMWRSTPEELAKRLGEQQAKRLIEATLSAADDLFADIRKYDVQCDHVQNGWIQASHCNPARKRLEHLATAWTEVGAPIEFLDKAQTQVRSGSNEYDFSVFHKRAGHVHPLSLTRGYAKAAIRLGAQIFENSPVVSIVREGEHWLVSTPAGSVRTRQVILTTNAYSDDLWPNLKQTFHPLVSISLATAPLSDNLRKSVLPNSVTSADTRRAIFYSRYDRDGRLIFGCVGSNDDPATLGGINRLKRGLRIVFPQLTDTEIETFWAGRIAVTPEMMPHLHEPDKGVLAGLGFSGRGIAMTSVMGRTLAKKALGAANDTLPFPVLPIKPIPFHWAAKAMIPLAAPAMTLRDQMDTVLSRKK